MAFGAATFIEVHQGSVRGLNALLPAMGATAILITGALALRTWRRGGGLAFYGAALVLMAAAAAITRFANQPINAEIMGWAADSMPAD